MVYWVVDDSSPRFETRHTPGIVSVFVCVFVLVAPFYLSLYVAQEACRTAGFGVSIRSCAGQPRHLSQQGLLNLSVCQRLGLCKHHTALRDKHTHMTFLTLSLCVGGCLSEFTYMDYLYFCFWGGYFNEFGHFKDILFTSKVKVKRVLSIHIYNMFIFMQLFYLHGLLVHWLLVHPKIKHIVHIFTLACSAIYPSTLFLC